MRAALLLIASALVAACSMTPPLPAPRIDTPTQWRGTAPSSASASGSSLANWWQRFNDPVLTDLVTQALADNHNLAVATARLRDARAAAGSADGRLGPTLDARGSGGLRRDDLQAERLRFRAAEQSFYQLGLNASWEIDVFGAARATAKAAAAEADAAGYGLADVQVSLAAEVAREYFALRGVQAPFAVAKRNIALQEDARQLLDSRVRAGLAPAVDASRASADLSLLRGSLPPLEAAVAGSGYRLAVLTGVAPAALPTTLSTPRALPDSLAALPLGLPSDLLKRRPDLRRAEAEVLAANERVGVARADLLPKFYLSGLLARAEEDNGDFTFGPGLLYSIGPTVSLPIFNAGRLGANVQIGDARLQHALARYEQAMLLALQDVEIALVNLDRERQRGADIAAVVTSATLTRSLARTRYERGLADYFAVIDAQRSLQSSEDALAVSRTAAVQHLTALYKALGGGWDETATLAVDDGQRRRLQALGR